MRKWARVFCFALTAMLMLSAIPVFAVNENSHEEAPEDFVIVLDCSESLIANDPQNLRLAACKSFIDKLPSQNTRVSVIAFGYQNDPVYDFSSGSGVSNRDIDANGIHQVFPLTSLEEKGKKDEYKAQVERVLPSKWSDNMTWTPIGHAVMAGVDVLDQAKTPDGKACIILVSDGVHKPLYTKDDQPLLDRAADAAGSHQWPIYCIELNYASNPDKNEVQSAQQLMDNLCAKSGGRPVGRLDCRTPAEVHVAYQQIFHDFYCLPGDAENVVQEVKLPGEYEFQVPTLTSEANVDVFGSSVERVELYQVKDGVEQLQWEIKNDYATDNLIAVVEDGSYYSIKMICPAGGTWKLKVYGDSRAKVLVSNSSLQEMGLRMVSAPNETTEMLTKNGKIAVDGFFAYRGVEVHNTDFYEQNPASLLIYNSRGTVAAEYPMKASPNGYHYDLDLRNVPSGKFDLQLKLEHNMFRNGRKVSNAESYELENLLLQDKNAAPAILSAYVNSDFPSIDMSQVFLNPDKDPITYDVICTSDRTSKFDFEVKEDYLTIHSGLKDGSFDLKITAADPDMENPLTYVATVTVEDRKLESKKIRDQELWLDHYFFQKDSKATLDLNLDDYFIDPDGVTIQYNFNQQNKVSSACLTGEHKNILHLEPTEKGKTLVKVTGSDGITQKTLEFELTVTSGKASYWKHSWIYYVISLLVILTIAIIGFVVFKNKRVKGLWHVVFDENGAQCDVPDIDIGAHTHCGHKARFTLKELTGELSAFLDPSMTSLKNNLSSYFSGTGAEDIVLGGVYSRKGMKVVKIPKDSQFVKVSCNSGAIRKAAKIGPGNTLTVQINSADGCGDLLIITMKL